MSGLEIAGLVVGVVPIVVEILKSYNATKDRLKTFAHHAQVVYDVQLRYRVASTNFSNDLHLLLKAVVDDAHELSVMLEDPKHHGWQAVSLEDRFRNFLERDYQLCEEIVVRIRDVLRETQARLSAFCVGQGEPRQTVVRRLYQAFNISLKENQYRRWLDDLDQWNAKLGRLRAQRCKIQKGRTVRSDRLIRKSVPPQYSDIRNASQRLFESLKDSWSCTNVSHTGHQAKLSLEAKAEYGTAQLDMVIACRRRELVGNPNLPLEAPIWLHVRSISSNGPMSSPALRSPILANRFSTPLQKITDPSGVALSRSVVQTERRTSKRVRLDETSDRNPNPDRLRAASSSPPSSSRDPHAISFAMLDLKATQSICCHLSKACLSSACKDSCLGYLEMLEAPQTFKFIFYDASRDTEAKIPDNTLRRQSYSINEMLQSLQILHQLTLAHRLATATLQYHSTSWLSEDWNLQDIAYFTDAISAPGADITNKIKTLHLSTQFPVEKSAELTQSNPEHLKYMYGIRNMTLAKLGVALLEIAVKQDISSFSADVTPHRVINARKLLLEESSSLAMLGKRYIKIARKCIDCDFSCGDNLNEDELRSAVYTDVVCALEDMIRDWKRFLGSN